MKSKTLLGNCAKYVAKTPDENGLIHYSAEEDQTWKFLLSRQMDVIQYSACDVYLKGIESLNFPKNRIPQCSEVSEVLMCTTGWSIERVLGFTYEKDFFKLLAQNKFPAATFIRRWDERDYLKEPDIFHEFFGHCPMLTDLHCVKFLEYLGYVASMASPDAIQYLARLYWFTFEMGLVQSPEGPRIYGGAVLSSQGETRHCLEATHAVYKPFNLIDVLCTPYRIDILQPVYFVIQDFSELYELTKINLLEKIDEAQSIAPLC